ncbi:MAG: hypothetical protein ABIP56_01765 [Dokdonella sp.]
MTPKLFESLLFADKNLIVMSTSEPSVALSQLRQLAMRGGQAVYVWEPQLGIAPMRDVTARIAGTERLGDALRYIHRSRHFGIYVFMRAERELRAEHTGLLQAISDGDNPAARKLAFLGSSFNMPADLVDSVEYLRCNGSSTARLRLRDGKWLR